MSVDPKNLKVGDVVYSTGVKNRDGCWFDRGAALTVRDAHPTQGWSGRFVGKGGHYDDGGVLTSDDTYGLWLDPVGWQVDPVTDAPVRPTPPVTGSREDVVRLLAEIDAALATGTGSARNLWQVLTALRSDDADPSSKPTSTVPIRRRAFPKTAARGYTAFAIFEPAAPFVHPIVDGRTHFREHAELAWQALAYLGVPEERKPFQRSVVDATLVKLFTIDGDPEHFTLDQLLTANPDMTNELSGLADLSVGTDTTVGGGAGAEFTIRRVQ